MLRMYHRISKEDAKMLLKRIDVSRFCGMINLTLEDVMKLSPIYRAPEGGYEIYAIQFGDVTLLFWFRDGSCSMKEVCW